MFKVITECRCCGSKNLIQYLDLKKQPLANSYHKKDICLENFELCVNVCGNCFHSQLSIVVNPEIMFKNYLYVSGTTETFRKHCENFSKYCVELHGGDNISVLDIACNDGTLLENFRTLDCSVFGVDPAENLRVITKEKQLDVVVDFWNFGISKRLNKKFDIITGTNVFAHVDNVYEFLIECKNCLNINGIIVLEFPYALDFIFKNEFDTVYHEHLSYFCVNSMNKLCERVGLNIFDIVCSDIHGGSIRFSISTNKQKTKLIDEYISIERGKFLLDMSSYKNYQTIIDNIKSKFVSYSKTINLIGYAASAKGNTALNYYNVNNINYIVDDNPLKIGFFTPGCNIEIKNVVDGLDVDDPIVILILAWNFKNEIVDKIKKIRKNRKTTICAYVPDFYVEEII